MALFGLKKKKDEVKEAVKETAVVKDNAEAKKEAKPKVIKSVEKKSKTMPSTESGKDLSGVLLKPRITEKATSSAEHGVYVFEVDPRATKKDIAHAVLHFYGTAPAKVSIVTIPSKEIFSRVQGKRGRKSSGKKAYVYLKEGDKIEIV